MYSRNLAKSSVRASPSFSLSGQDRLFSPNNREHENQYRYHIPAGYDGSRFSRAVQQTEPEPKRHIADRLPESDRGECVTGEIGNGEQEKELCPVPHGDGDTAEPPTENHSLSHLIGALKEHVSGEDLLLIVIILMLAAEGENAELTILLLSLLLLVK